MLWEVAVGRWGGAAKRAVKSNRLIDRVRGLWRIIRLCEQRDFEHRSRLIEDVRSPILLWKARAVR